jgi:hypothetical protein
MAKQAQVALGIVRREGVVAKGRGRCNLVLGKKLSNYFIMSMMK